MAGHNEMGPGSGGSGNEVIDDTPFNPDELLTSPLFNDSQGKLSVNLEDEGFGNGTADEDELAKFCDDVDNSDRSNPLSRDQRKVDSAPRSPRRSTRSPVDRDALIGQLASNSIGDSPNQRKALNSNAQSGVTDSCGSPRERRNVPHNMPPNRPVRVRSNEELPLDFNQGVNNNNNNVVDRQMGSSPNRLQNRNIGNLYRQRSDDENYCSSPSRQVGNMGYPNDNQYNSPSRTSSNCSYNSMPANFMQGNGMQGNLMQGNGMQGNCMQGNGNSMQGGIQGNGMNQMHQNYEDANGGYVDPSLPVYRSQVRSPNSRQGSGYSQQSAGNSFDGNSYDAMQMRQMQQQDMQRRQMQQQMQMQHQQQQQMQMQQMNRQRANSCNQVQARYGPNQPYDMGMQQFDNSFNADSMPHNSYHGGDQMQMNNQRNSYNGDSRHMNNQYNQYNGDQYRGSYRDSIGNDSFRSHESDQSSQMQSQGVPDSLLGGMDYGDNVGDMGYDDGAYNRNMCNNGGYNNGNIHGGPAPGYAGFHVNNNNVSIATDMQSPNKPYMNDSSPSNGNAPAAINEAMEKLCERMKKSAMSRNMIKQFSGRNLVKQSSGRSLIASQNSASLVLAKQRSNRVLMRQASDRGANMNAGDCSALALQRQASARGLARQQSSRGLAKQPSSRGLVKQPSARGIVKQPSARGLTREPSLRGLVRRPSNTKHHLQHPGRGTYGHDSHSNLGSNTMSNHNLGNHNLGNNGITLSIDGRNVGTF